MKLVTVECRGKKYKAYPTPYRVVIPGDSHTLIDYDGGWVCDTSRIRGGHPEEFRGRSLWIVMNTDLKFPKIYLGGE